MHNAFLVFLFSPFLRTIFDRCETERRTLITTSSKLLLRKDCPPGAYLLDTKSLKNLETTLVHLLLSHGVTLVPQQFLSRCVVCNGSIDQVHDRQRIQEIFISHQAPDNLMDSEIFEVYQCTGCCQGYWWDERPTSSASRVKNQATKLLEVCIRGNVPVADDMAMFDYVDVQAVQQQEGGEECVLLEQRLDVLGWLQEESLQNPLGSLTSAYTDERGDETISFTNVTADFLGQLDYIMYPKDQLQVHERLYVPKSLKELNSEDIRNGHLLPSNVWPSDHLAVGARLSFVNQDVTNQSMRRDARMPTEHETELNVTNPIVTEQDNKSDGNDFICTPIGGETTEPSTALMCSPVNASNQPTAHGQRCACGCVPNVLSLFEMAELRKQARLKQQS